MDIGGRQSADGRRGQSELVGLSLLFGLVIIGASLVFVAGSVTLDSAQKQVQQDSAEREMVATNAELRDVSASPSSGDTTDLPLDDGVVSDVTVEENETRLSVEALDSNGNRIDGDSFRVGTATYRDENTRITAEAGAVWRKDETGTKMVSSPSLSREQDRIDFNVIDVRQNTNTARARATKSNVTQFFPNLEEISSRPPADVVIVSDESGSMRRNDPNGLRLQATNQFIGDIAAEEQTDRVAAVHFSLWENHLRGCGGSAAFSPRDTDARVVNDLSDPTTVSASRQPDRCGTNYHAGLKQAMELLESQSSANRRKVIVFMGDGEHEAIEQYGNNLDGYEFAEDPTAANVRRLAEQAEDRNITIHTIGFSDGLSAPGERLLQDMTTDEGTYQFADDPEDLEPVFENVFSEVVEEQPPDRVRIEIESEFADGWERYLRQEFGTVERVDESTVAATVDTSNISNAGDVSIRVAEVKVGT